MKHAVKLLVLCGFLMISRPAFGQTGANFRGQVVDEVNAVIPGATVILISKDGKSRNAVSGANGEFTFQNVAAGTYTVTVGFKGFQPYKNDKVVVPPPNNFLKVEMVVETMTVETEVRADDNVVTVEPDQNANATVLGEEFIQTLPDNEDDLRAYLQALAGPGAAGASGGEGGAQIYVNGFSAGRLPPREAIMQIRFNQNPFAAEYSRPGSGRVDIVTKPGNDSLRGSVNVGYRNSLFDARNSFAVTKPDLDQRRFGFTLSGPIIRKKMSFFANIERRNLTGASPVVATTLTGPFTANIESPSDNTNFNGRVDYLLNDKNTIGLNYNYSRGNNYNREFSVGRFGGGGGFGGGGAFGGGAFGGGGGGSTANYTLPEQGSDSRERNHSVQLSDTWIINSRLIHEARLQYRRENTNTLARTEGVTINVLDAFNGGASNCCPNEQRETRLELQDYLTFSYKKHTLKGGFQLEYGNLLSNNRSNFNGTYTFSSLEIYRSAVNGQPLPPGTIGRSQFTINRGNPELNFNQSEMSWFVQDDFRFSPSLTLSFGLRHEFQTNLADKNNFAPRASIAWSPISKTTFRVGGGMFYSRLSDGTYSSILRYNGDRQVSIIINNPTFPDPFAGNPDLSVQNTFRRVLDPDLKAPYIINFNASVERQLPKGLIGTFTYMYTRGVHQFRSRNINAPLPLNGVRPNPNEGNVFNLESSASSEYNGFIFGLNRRMGSKFTFFGNYSLAWNKNDAGGAFSTPANNYDLASEWGRAGQDRRHSLFIGGSVNLPWGIRLGPMINASSGTPFNILTGTDDNRDTSFSDRPIGLARNADLPVSLYSLIPNRCIQNCGIGQTQVLLQEFLLANYPNGVIAQNPGALNISTSVSKTFSFGTRDQSANAAGRMGGGGRGGMGGGMGGGMRGMGGGGFGMGGGNESGRFNLTFNVQITNIINRTNYGSYGGTLGSPYFGLSSSSSAPRQFEFGIRFGF